MTHTRLEAKTVLAISGSLQSRSSNTALIQLASQVTDERVQVQLLAVLPDLPYFNPELDVEPAPASVTELRARVGAADGLLIASPEYAHEMPGVLKNALDWLVSSGELYGKSVAVLCASPAPERGRYVREALGRTLDAQGARVVFSATVAGEPIDVVRAALRALAVS
ncbi:MAG: NAD(P)H-dependent oxidoreductase [Chloroflexi bacterium]|nr:NAD(P)H-dependent oxidoreductase [Chloroflexota bacterium]